jgi:hypothetical protein
MTLRAPRGRAQLAPPMRGVRIADICDWRATALRRCRHSPAQHALLSLTVRRIEHNRRRVIGEDPRQRRKVARGIASSTDELPDGLLAFGH